MRGQPRSLGHRGFNDRGIVIKLVVNMGLYTLLQTSGGPTDVYSPRLTTIAWRAQEILENHCRVRVPTAMREPESV